MPPPTVHSDFVPQFGIDNKQNILCQNYEKYTLIIVYHVHLKFDWDFFQVVDTVKHSETLSHTGALKYFRKPLRIRSVCCCSFFSACPDIPARVFTPRRVWCWALLVRLINGHSTKYSVTARQIRVFSHIGTNFWLATAHGMVKLFWSLNVHCST